MFDFLRKRSELETGPVTPATQGSATAPSTQIQYSPDLIKQLVADHRKLLGIYQEIKQSFADGDYTRVLRALDEFRRSLQGHLLTENVRMYVYLDRHLAGDESNSNLIRGFRREMDGIGKMVMNFLKKYESIGVDANLAEAFYKDFASIGAVLAERIKKEEQMLYPLYTPYC